MTNIIKNFWNDEEGATAIEYGLIAGLIAVAIIGVLTLMGTNLTALFTTISNALSEAATSGSGGGGGSN
ncbi:Flp family type IVb pilin [Comamonas piscis]|uniref:Flp family type IVb pilin n=1 Tax=Comamonas piscis TaxID=1562974 RepID=A0A7G5EJB8_9BURK|nr:Flp family type IVb pilin [Comamonas piscis]QMV74093.1 Flp family type IVb pilin [Comamonas piscis]WSO32532.1 Flp family type IVb pilin [Comamonas piscis]